MEVAIGTAMIAFHKGRKITESLTVELLCGLRTFDIYVQPLKMVIEHPLSSGYSNGYFPAVRNSFIPFGGENPGCSFMCL